MSSANSVKAMYAKWDNFKDSSSDSEDADDDDEPWPKPPPKAAPRATVESAATIIDKLARAELLGEEILVDRKQLVELDRKRNQNREALAALRRTARQEVGQAGAAAAAAEATTKHWMCLGDYFVRKPQSKIVESLQADQQRIEAEIESLNKVCRRSLDSPPTHSWPLHCLTCWTWAATAGHQTEDVGAVRDRPFNVRAPTPHPLFHTSWC